MIDWKKAAEDGAICYFWQGEHRPERPFVCRLEFVDGSRFLSENQVWFDNCMLVLESDEETYKTEEYVQREYICNLCKTPCFLRVIILSESINKPSKCPFVSSQKPEYVLICEMPYENPAK